MKYKIFNFLIIIIIFSSCQQNINSQTVPEEYEEPYQSTQVENLESIDNLNHIIVIGTSCQGDLAVKELLPRLNLDNTAIIIKPHVNGEEMYQYLLELSLNYDITYLSEEKYNSVDFIEIKHGSIYIIFDVVTTLKDNSFILKTSDGFFTNDNKQYYIRENEIAFIDDAFRLVAEQYGSKSIGLVLTGSGGGEVSDAVEGAKYIKEKGGKIGILSGFIEEGDNHLEAEINLINHCWTLPNEVKDNVNEDFSGIIEELAIWINNLIVD